MMAKKLLYLSRTDVEASGVGMADIISAVKAVFVEKGKGKVEMPPKPGVHSRPDAFIHAMPAFIPAMDALGMKWVSGYPENFKRGIPYINGLIVLNDVETGVPLAVMDCVWVTAMRTGAATAVSAKYLARKDSKTLGILGAGVQGFTNLSALKELFPIEGVIAFDIDQGQLDRYVNKVIDRWPDLDVVKADNPRQAVVGLDMVVTAGPIMKQPHATIQKGWLSRGAFASLVDFDSYWSAGAMREADKFLTDDLAQLNHYKEVGYFQNIPAVYGDLGELAAEKKVGRESESERILTCNLGLAIEDMATAMLIYKKASAQGIGVELDL
jgi:ornithine cyclodeaminase/alanine dehydrogenase